jgi:hypothetical protein
MWAGPPPKPRWAECRRCFIFYLTRSEKLGYSAPLVLRYLPA